MLPRGDGAQVGHRPLSGGTATPRAVPTWTWPRSNLSKGVTRVSGVHRRGDADAPPGHRHWWGGATATFSRERGRLTWSPPWSQPL
jgi:hypothetical protein